MSHEDYLFIGAAVLAEVILSIPGGWLKVRARKMGYGSEIENR
jgi:hypothetical protein